jgi:hypothetical protein
LNFNHLATVHGVVFDFSRAVAQAAAQYPDLRETTYRDCRNNLAYYMK